MYRRKSAALLLSAVLCASPVLAQVSPVVMAMEVDPQTTVLDVTEFGADPSGMSDSTDAVAAAIEKAKSMEGHVTLHFPNGEYHFDEDHATPRVYHTSNTSSRSYPEKKVAILLEDADNITLQGDDTTIVVHGDIMALGVVRSSNIKLKGLTIDYKDADTIDLSVVKTGTDENGKPFADFYIPAAYNYVISEDGKHIQWQGDMSEKTGKPYWTWTDANFCAMLVVYKGYDRTVARCPNKAASNPFKDVVNLEQTSDSVVRFTYDSAFPTDVEEGNIYMLSDSATRKTVGAFFWESENLLVEDMDVHYLSGFGWLTQMSKNIEYKNVNFLPRINSGKYTSSNADQIHVAGCGGYFKVTDCNFSMAHDDPINIHGTYMRVEEVMDDRTLKVKYIHGQQGGFRQFHENDQVMFYTRTYLEPAYGQTDENPFIVESSVGPYEEYNGSKLDHNTEIVTFKEDLPEETLNDLRKRITYSGNDQPLFVAENVTYTPEVTIKGNHFKSIPTRGILCTTRKPVVIEENVFDNMAMANIYLSNDADYWYESGPITNMTIRNNQFYIRPTASNEWGNVSGVYINPVMVNTGRVTSGETTQRDPNSGVHQNITIDSNTFHLSNDNAVTAERVEGLTITNNTVLNDMRPDLTLTCPETLGVGESTLLNASAVRRPLNKNVFSLYSCHDVTIGGNTFDDDLNLNIGLSGNMSASDVSNTNSELTMNKSGGNHVQSIKDIHYTSSDPAIAYVDENGKLHGVKAGTASITAWATKGDTLVSSAPVTVSVEGEISEPITLTAEKRTATARNEKIKLTSSSKNTVWEVIDPATGKHSYKGVVDENGNYTALQHGAVLVRAIDGSSSAEVMISNSFGEKFTGANIAEGMGYHNYRGTSTSAGDTNVISGLDAYTVHYDTQDFGNGPWTGTNNLGNVLHFEIPESLQTDFRVQVDVTGMTGRTSQWGSDGVMLYNDMDNYVFTGKRQHQAGMASMREVGGSCSEYQGNAADNELKNSTIEFEGKGSTLTVRYTDANGAWKTAGTFDIAFLQNKAMQFGATTWENKGTGQNPTYSGFRIGKASETTTDNLATVGEYKAIFTPEAHTAPELESVSAAADGRKVTATATPKSGSALTGTVYFWTLTTEDGETITASTTTNQWTAPMPGSVVVDAIGIDAYGEASALQSSDPVEVKDTTAEPGKFSTVFFNGLPVQIDADSSEITVSMPMSDTVRISWPEAEKKESTVITSDSDTQTIENASFALVKASDQFVLKRDSQTVTVNVNRLLSSDTGIKTITLEGKALDLTDQIRDNTDSYMIQPEGTEVPIHIETADPNAKINVRTTYFDLPLENKSGKDNVFDAILDMNAGINHVYVDVTAPNGKTVREYKLYFFKDAFANDKPESITLNGKELEGFTPEKDEYVLRLSAEEMKNPVLSVIAAEDQKVTIKDAVGFSTTGEKQLFVEPGVNKIDVEVQAPDYWSRKRIRINVIGENETNADLLSLKLDGITQKLPGNGDEQVIEYNAFDENLPLNVIALGENAKIEVVDNITGETYTGTGTLDTTLHLGEGDNRLTLTVSEEGKESRSIDLHIHATGLVWASDRTGDFINGNTEAVHGLRATKATVGYGAVAIDTNVGNNNKIRLADENGEAVTFEKGIGAHASSELIYTFEDGHDFTTFEAFCGIDYVQYNTNLSSVDFKVYVDDKLVYNSNEVLGGVTRAITPMQKISVDITGASTLRLVADQVDNNSYDHSEWADAKFLRTLPEIKVNKEALKAKLDEAKAIEESSVSETKWQKLQDAIEKAQAVFDDENATAADVAKAIDALSVAISWNDTVLNRVMLEFLIEATSNYSAEDYKADTFEIFAAKLAEAKEVLKSAATQAELDKAVNELNPAILDLRLLPNEDKLKEVMDSLN